MGSDVATVVAVGDLGRIVGYEPPTDHARKTECVFLKLRSVGGCNVAGVEASGYMITGGSDTSHHAVHGVEGVVVFLYIV